MNLLVLSPWFPAPPDNGSRLRAFHLLRAWHDAGHTIRLVTGLQDDITDTADHAALSAICESVQVFPWRWHDGKGGSPLGTLLSPVPRSVAETQNPAMVAAMEAELSRKPDVCIAFQLAAAPFIPRETHGVPILLEEVEITGVARAVATAPDTKTRLLASLTKAKHNAYWKRELRRFAALTVVSQEEADALAELLGGTDIPVAVVPNGVDGSAHAPRIDLPVPGRLLYNGSLTYPPNAIAVAWFVQHILPG
ncbi:MAG: glycosyltransferase, partial [Armatimonadetes bacterium]|nr:glycosyltransferase [Armatimonadota bacterium]